MSLVTACVTSEHFANNTTSGAMVGTVGASSGNQSQSQSSNDRQTRDQRDILRFMYQTSAKGKGKGYQDWLNSWRQCRATSVNVMANSLEGVLNAFKVFRGCNPILNQS